VDQDSDNYVRASGHASAVEGLYAHQLWIARQMFPDTADTENLELHAVVHGLRRKAATRASGILSFAGEPGAVVPAGTESATGDGQVYATVQAGTVDTGPLTSRPGP
jgi:uncharacterized phage protein gp47/JayE